MNDRIDADPPAAGRVAAVLARIVKRREAFLIVGVLAVILGVVMLSASTQTCGEDTMYDNDVCLTTGQDDSPVRLTHDEEVRGGRRGGWAFLGLGAFALFVGGAGYAVGMPQRLRDRRDRPAPGPGPRRGPEPPARPGSAG